MAEQKVNNAGFDGVKVTFTWKIEPKDRQGGRTIITQTGSYEGYVSNSILQSKSDDDNSDNSISLTKPEKLKCTK